MNANRLLNLGNVSKNRYESFLVLSSFTEFFYFVPNILLGIVEYLKYHIVVESCYGSFLVVICRGQSRRAVMESSLSKASDLHGTYDCL